MKRGEVWWAELPRPDGRRPVLLLSRDSSYDVRSAATVVALTRTIRQIPSEVRLEKSDGVPETCVVNADVIMTVPISILGRRITALAPEKLEEVEAAVRFALDL